VKKFALPPRNGGQLALVTGALVALSVVAAACGGGGAPTSVKSSSATTSTTAAAAGASNPTKPAGHSNPAGTKNPAGPNKPGGPGSPPGGVAAFAPAASGIIASISGDTLEVQGISGQTTVDLNAKTKFTATLKASLSDVVSGGCITATGTKGAKGAVDATTVIIEAVRNGTCAFGLGGGSGGGRAAGGGGFPGAGSSTGGSGSGTTFRRPANIAFASGKVTSVSGSAITVKPVSFARPGASTPSASTSSGGTPSTGGKPSTTAGPETVVVSSSTTYTKPGTVTVKTLKVGECATAIGSTNDIGVVTATRLSISPATNGSCTGGFGFGRGRFGAGAGAGGTSPVGGAGATS
jgi:hypothetical protein